jgi:hypothetical protein
MFDLRVEGVRGAVDLFHFAVGFAGFAFAAGGVVISSPCVGCMGLLLFAWGVAYFFVNNDEV